MRTNHRPRAASRAHPFRFGTLTALVVAASASLAGLPTAGAATPPVLEFNDQGFELASAGLACSSWWAVSSGAGCASNNPHYGTHAAFLDQGDGYSVSQSIQSPVAGLFDFSAWIAASTGGTGGTFSVRSSSGAMQTLTLPANLTTNTYIKYTLPRIQVAANDTVTVTFTSSSGRNWVNIDDIEVVPSAPNDPQVSSSNPTVVAMFDWAKVKANS
ncbi:hypothetical protein [Paraburkholderia sp.]|uniref:hypothetical protein n=1 Tax=Paraburkholderia sp. TaxID=1926495 RepID=UPI003D6DD43B